MIVKKTGLGLPASTLYGIAGGIFGVVTIMLMISSQMAPDSYPSCSERYAKAGIFGLERAGGQLLGPTELQSELAGREWGVLQNLAIKRDKNPVGNAAMAITFRPGGTADRGKRVAASGVGFNWQPGFLSNSDAACLSYSVRVPADFKFAAGGTLPGLLGTLKFGKSDAKPAFSTRMRWLENGRLGIHPVTHKVRTGMLVTLSGSWLSLPRDKWVNIEQEVVLNTPDKADGVLRVWVDGRLHLNMSGIAYRTEAGTGFAGVIADTHYSDRSMHWMPSPTATEVKLSPLVVRWNDK